MEKYFYFCMFVCTSSLCKSCEQCCEECCDCLYSGEIENDPSGNLLPIKNKGNIVIKLEQSSIDNIVEVVKQNNRNHYAHYPPLSFPPKLRRQSGRVKCK